MGLIFDLTVAIVLVWGVYFVYNYFKPTIRYSKYINALKIGMVVKTGEEQSVPVKEYLEKSVEKIESINKEIEKKVARAITETLKKSSEKGKK